MSNREGRNFFSFFRAGVEGLWVIAAAGFVVYVTVGRPFPLLSGVVTFLAAAALTRALWGRGLRRIAVLIIHLSAFSACLFLGLGGFMPHRDLIPADGDWMSWGWTTQTAFWLGILWVKGAAFSRHPGTRDRICSQFDQGVAWFGLMLLVSFLVEVKGGLPASWGGVLPLFFLFFVLGIAAMGLSGPSEQEGAKAGGAPGALWFLAFAVLVAGVGTGAILFFMPLLMHGAEMGAEALKTTTSPIGPVLLAILRFLFGRRRMSVQDEAPPETAGTASPFEGGGALGTGLESALGWVLAVVLGLLLAIMLVIVLLYAVKSLLSRTRPEYARTLRLFVILELFIRWLGRMRGMSPVRKLRALRDPDPVRLFSRLSAWGACSGSPRNSTDTPMEYGVRLGARFKDLSGDIMLLVDLVNRELYADLRPGPAHRREGLEAWRRLRSPRNWYPRLRALLRPFD